MLCCSQKYQIKDKINHKRIYIIQPPYSQSTTPSNSHNPNFHVVKLAPLPLKRRVSPHPFFNKSEFFVQLIVSGCEFTMDIILGANFGMT